MRIVPPLTGRLDMALSNFVKGYRQGNMIADLLFPRLPVLRQRDVYWVYGRENLQLTEQTLRAFGTPAQETRFALSTANYQVKSHALKAMIPDEDRDTYTVGDLDTDTVSMLQDKIMLDREFRVRGIVTNPANYAANNTLALSGTSQWSDYADSDPIGDMEHAKFIISFTGQAPNTLILTPDVARVLRVHPKIREYFKYTQNTGPLNDAQLATAFGVDKVVIATGLSNDGSDQNQFIWTNLALLVYVSPTVGNPGVLGGIGAEGTTSPRQLSFGKTFVWTTAPGTVDGYGVVIGRHPDATAKTDILGVDMYSDERVTGTDCGVLFTTPIAA